MQLNEGKLRGAIDGNKHVLLALFGAQLGNVDVKTADRVALELLLRRPITIDFRQAADTAKIASDAGSSVAAHRGSH